MPVVRTRPWAALLLVAVTLLTACRRDAPEAEIRQTIADMVEAAEARQLGDFMDHIAEGYTDADSNDIAALRGQLFVLFQRTASLRITHRIESVAVGVAAVPGGEPDPSQASAVVIAGMADGPIVDPSSNSQVMRFELEFARDGAWRVTEADWTRVSAGALLGL